MPKAYNVNFPDDYDELMVELLCFKDNHLPEKGGLGAYRHFRNALSLTFPKLETHEWSTSRYKSFCENTTNIWIGSASAGKTYDAGVLGVMFWLVDPLNTSVILTSTTGKMVRKRIWPVIQELYFANPLLPGNLVDSRTTLQSRKGDDKHGIFAIAVRDGPVDKAVADIQGLHSERMLLVIDEATDTPEAVFKAICNLRKGCTDFRVIIIFNPASHLDPGGRCAEPVNGWNSISVEDTEWETKGVPEWEIEGGVCLHFDGMKSPNIRLGKDKYPYLFTNADLQRALAVPEAQKSLGFWKYTRGFWPPEGSLNCVMSEQLVEKYDGLGKHVFESDTYNIAGLDPAFGGDNCILRFATVGKLTDGRKAIQLGKRVVIPIKITSKEPAHYQIAHRVIQECRNENVLPHHFGLDATGEGGGLASILATEWSDQIEWVEFGGSASDMPISDTDNRPACDLYDRKVTELWYQCREFLVRGLLKGLSKTDVVQFCARQLDDKKRKISLDTKDDCKKKIGHSPDDADAVTVVVEVARRLGIVPRGTYELDSQKSWLEIARKDDDSNNNVESDDLQWEDNFSGEEIYA